jgi:hypothetical protein
LSPLIVQREITSCPPDCSERNDELSPLIVQRENMNYPP